MAMLNIFVGQMTDPKKVVVSDSTTVSQLSSTYNMSGLITLNGASIDASLMGKTLAQLQVSNDDYICCQRKAGGNR